MAPNQGKITMEGLDVEKDADKIKKKIGYLPENNPLYTDMGIIDYLKFCAAIQGVPKEKISDRIHAVVDVCGLNQERHKKIGELSKGYRQRVGLAQAMVHDPDVLVLDEPTSGLDPNQIIEIRKLIKKLGKEKTVILSSHILSEVEATCDRILIIHNGKIVADGTSETLRSQAQGQELIKVSIEAPDDKNIEKELLELASVESVKPIEGSENFFLVQSKPEHASRKEVFDLCVKNKWYLMELTGIETKLEDVFRELTN
jgi:ABC-2 type transport system ATP-binding protein